MANDPARPSRYLEALRERVLVYDGAMGTSIFTYNLSAEDYGGERTRGCNDYLVLTRPDVISDIHRSFFEAGCDVAETCTFQASRLRLEEWGLGEHTYAINREAARLAREAADEFEARDGRPRFVAGSLGPTGKMPSSDDPVLGDTSFDQLTDVFFEQASALIEGGADVLLVETSFDLLELKAAVDGARRAREAANRMDVAVQAQVFIELSGRMLLGTEIPAVTATLEALPIDVLGMNCSTGPEQMRDAIRYFTGHTHLPVSCIPNAGLPLNVDGQEVYPLDAATFARILGEYVHEYGVAVVGGCCGTRPEHIAALRAAVGAATAPKERSVDDAPHVASNMGARAMHQEPRPLIIGERVNSLGSRKVKKLLLKDDYDGLLEIAREQVESGAHTLDVCVATTERADEAAQMVALTRKLAMSVDAPLVFDSTEADVLEAALKVYPGRAILNSTSLEGGRGKKIDQTLPLAKRFGAAVVAIAIDEEGMAHTPEEKLRVCRRIYDIATQEYGLPPHALIFDVNVFPITTGQAELRDEAAWTLAGVRLVKENLPGALTSLGVSNLSFGVAPHARAALNSVFLYHAVAAGLDMAIINPAHITPYAEVPADERALCEDLIFNRREDALASFIQHFDTTSTADSAKNERADPTEGMSVEQRIHWKILHRKKDGVENDIDEALQLRVAKAERELRIENAELRNGADSTASTAADNESSELSQLGGEADELSQLSILNSQLGGKADELSQFSILNSQFRGEAAVDILNSVLLPAMKDVGDRFGAGELILPFVLQSAEVMKRAVAHLEQFLDKQEGVSKGRVVLATVYGDVHDIGKSLVNTILSNNGYTVYDLGKQVPVNTIIEKAQEVNADAIGLSALLVSTSKQMPLCVQELDRRGLNIPVLVGGAAINKQYGQRISFVEEARPYDAGVFYCKDAFEGLEVMDNLSSPARRAEFVEQARADAAQALNKPQRGRMVMAEVGRANGADTRRSAVRSDAPIPVPPFWGPQVARRFHLQDVAAKLDRNALYRLQWGAKNAKGAEWERLRAEFDARLSTLLREAERDGWLDLKAVYGYFPAQALGNDVIIYDPASVASGAPRELTRFAFPRQPKGERLCLADYVAPAESGRMDTVAFQIVTVGDKATEVVDQLQREGDYSRGYYLHGMSVSLAEALADYLHGVIRKSLGLADGQGQRYAWGYPACPDLEDHAKLFQLLPTDQIDVDLTSAFQLLPEQSTAAIVFHHPEAKYFSIGSTLERAESDQEELRVRS